MPIFFTKKSCNRGGGTTPPPPQMPLTVKVILGRGLRNNFTKDFETSSAANQYFTFHIMLISMPMKS